LKGLFSLPQAIPPVQPTESLPNIQIEVGKAIKGVADTVQGVVKSEPVQSAAAAVQNAAGQAAEGVGNFIRSDAVQAQVASANSFWSSLTTQNKLLAASIGGLGLLMMSCCMCGFLGMMLGGPNRPSSETTKVQAKPSTSKEESAYSNMPPIESQESIENRRRIEERLAGFKHRDIISKYGQPSQTLQDPVQRNCKYLVWKIGSKDTELYVIQMVVFAIDGSGNTLDAPPFVVTDVGLARMIRKNNLE
jgi:hypothetical protein